ncbi:MAG: hypothetical protein ACOH2A_02525 [Sphingobacteriaceae bacterium]
MKLQIFLISRIPNSKILWSFSLFWLMMFFSCNKQKKGEFATVKIALAKDSQSIILKGLRTDVLKQLEADSLSMERWQTLMGIYKMPADSGLIELQKEQPGVYRILDQQIIFKPDTAFKSKKAYLCRFYGRNLEMDPLTVLFERKLPDVVSLPEATFHIK